MTCAKQLVTATVVAKDGRRFVGTNACAKPQVVCPRGDMPTGHGYELCASVCEQQGHAEVQALRAAGSAAVGATVYLQGHDYGCNSCIAALRAAGVAGLVIGPPPDDTRPQFEDACWAHYKGLKARGWSHPDEGDPNSREALFWREANGQYGVRQIEAAWRGWLMREALSQNA